jgi:hypothetical protein
MVTTRSRIDELGAKSHPSPKQIKGKIDSLSKAVLKPITFLPNRSIALPLACFFFPSFRRRSFVP